MCMESRPPMPLDLTLPYLSKFVFLGPIVGTAVILGAIALARFRADR